MWKLHTNTHAHTHAHTHTHIYIYIYIYKFGFIEIMGTVVLEARDCLFWNPRICSVFSKQFFTYLDKCVLIAFRKLLVIIFIAHFCMLCKHCHTNNLYQGLCYILGSDKRRKLKDEQFAFCKLSREHLLIVWKTYRLFNSYQETWEQVIYRAPYSSLYNSVISYFLLILFYILDQYLNARLQLTRKINSQAIMELFYGVIMNELTRLVDNWNNHVVVWHAFDWFMQRLRGLLLTHSCRCWLCYKRLNLILHKLR